MEGITPSQQLRVHTSRSYPPYPFERHHLVHEGGISPLDLRPQVVANGAAEKREVLVERGREDYVTETTLDFLPLSAQGPASSREIVRKSRVQERHEQELAGTPVPLFSQIL